MEAFVNNSQYMAGDFGAPKNNQALQSTLQVGAETWEELLHASDRKLKLSQCTFTIARLNMGNARVQHLENLEDPIAKIKSFGTGTVNRIRFTKQETPPNIWVSCTLS